MNVSSDDKHPGRQPTPLSIATGHSNASQFAVLDREEAVAEGGVGGVVEIENEKKEEPVTWRSLPHRSQLIVLTLARLSEPLVGTSLQVVPTILSIRAWTMLTGGGLVIHVLPAQVLR
jgi:hypothetical protein